MRAKPKGATEALFTIILDYRGGTYIGQATAPEPWGAILKWARGLDARAVAGFGSAKKRRLIQLLESDPWRSATALDSLKNVWCVGVLPGALINIVKTARRSQAKRA